MAKKITDLPALTVADDTDLFAVVDVSGNVTKKVPRSGLVPNGSVTLEKINGGTTAGAIVTNASGAVSSASPAVGILNLSSTGTKIVSGLPFKPSLIRVFGGVNSNDTRAINCVGVTNGSTIYCSSTYADTSARAYSRIYTDRISLLNYSAGVTTLVRVDTFVMVSDGFTYNAVSIDAGSSLIYEAYP